MRILLAAAALLGLLAAPAAAYDEIVKKQTFTLPSFTTAGGKTIKEVKVGWESYGKLNAARDNAILIAHFFSGDSHAAGKYAPEDKAAGYWDAIIGPGKPVDTDKYFVLSSDTLVNLNAKSPTVATTGPATINPDTGRPWGPDFPVVSIRDFVNVQKALVESLGIAKLHAVMGASMGALQALDWAAAHPAMVGRTVAVIGAGESDAWLIGWANLWAAPIMLDPNWKGGAYYGGAEPTEGLVQSLKIITLHARHPNWATAAMGRKWADPAKDPGAALGNLFAIEDWLDKAARGRAAVSDANHLLYLVKANQLYVAGHAGGLEEGVRSIASPVLLLPAAGDLLLYPEMSRRLEAALKAQGKTVEYEEIKGNLGHLDGIAAIASVGPRIAAFLAR
jgi:homoserine O-acetyltransferase/O-succinyltransferase